jgi:hypothetical protein
VAALVGRADRYGNQVPASRLNPALAVRASVSLQLAHRAAHLEPRQPDGRRAKDTIRNAFQLRLLIQLPAVPPWHYIPLWL